MTRQFGLLGKNIDYSFSRGYFKDKFSLECIDATYENFDIERISDIIEVLQNNKHLAGMNVTIPYKESVMHYLSEIDSAAQAIGAVNTIKVIGDTLKGFNTDYHGFKKAIKPQLQKHHDKALILGTGGASKAIAFALRQMNITFNFVSRNPDNNELKYTDLDEETIKAHKLIINCTPLGTHPDVDQMPDIPYNAIAGEHLLFDLIYNPSETRFLELGKTQGAQIQNGLKMLEYQAEKSWMIWNR